jgi:hypothetical protein
MSTADEVKATVPSPNSGLGNQSINSHGENEKHAGRTGSPVRSSTGGLRRLQVTLTERGFERLEKLRKDTDVVSQADVVRDALSYYESAVEEMMTGKRIVAEDPKNLSDRILLKHRLG